MLRAATAVVVGTVLAGAALAAPARAEAAPPPVVGQCSQSEQISHWVLSGTIVDCAGPHTGQTVYVGTWTSLTPPSQAAAFTLDGAEETDLRRQLDQQESTCFDAFAATIQEARVQSYIPSLFMWRMTGPNDEQWAAGQRWLRCEVTAEQRIAHSAPFTLVPLPAPAQLQGIMRTPLATNPYRVCAWEGKTSWAEVACTSKEAHYTFALAFYGSRFRWPGTVAAFWDKANAFCRSNPAIRSFGARPDDVEAWQTGGSKVSKATYKDARMRCVVYKR